MMKGLRNAAIVTIVACFGFLCWPSVGNVPVPETGRAAADDEERSLSAATSDAGGGATSPAPAAVHASETAALRIVDHAGPEISWTRDTPAAFHARTVELSPSLAMLDHRPLPVGALLELEDFDGNPLRGRVVESQTWGGGTHAIRADLVDTPGGFITLSVHDGFVRALAETGPGGRLTQVRFDVERGVHLLLDVDHGSSSVLKCAFDDAQHTVDCCPGHAAVERDALETGSGDLTDAPTSPSDEGTLIADVLILYTPAALVFEGSVPNMHLNASQSMLLANQVLANSALDLRLNLVQVAEIQYTETTSPSTDLIRITEFNNIADQVHDLRDHYAADFVVTFANLTRAGGVAWRPRGYDRPDWAFSMVRVQQSDTTSYTTIHEIGHNMGNGHSKTQRFGAYNGDWVAYAAGWQWADEGSDASIGYCSVMTYENFTGSGGREFRRVPHFSNPDVSYLGNPTGHPADGDAARVIREGSAYYVAFREVTEPSVVDHFPYIDDFALGDTPWRQSIDDTHRWTLHHSGDTPSSGTGPGGAFEGNHFAYVEASLNYGATAAIEADFSFATLAAPAFSFRYHMYGLDMGSLALEVSLDDGSSWDTLWSRSGNQGPDWQTAQVDLSALGGVAFVRLRFMGTVGPSYRSDLALDALRIEDAIAAEEVATYADWIAIRYPDIADPAPDADADGDGLSNFLEFALGRNPTVPNFAPPVGMTQDPTTKTFTCTFVRGQGTVRYRIWSTEDLSDWSSGQLEWDSATATDLVAVGAVQTVTIDATAPRKFIRLEVSEME